MANRRAWTDDDVYREILACSEDGVMPTVSQMTERGRSDLSNQVSRRGGFLHWASKCGLAVGNSCTSRGQKWEGVILDELIALGYRAARQTTRHPFDILVNGRVRINVKSAKFSEYGACRGHFFGIGHTWGSCDFFALVRVAEPRPPTLWVPWYEAQQQTVTLTPGHRLNDFTEITILDELAKRAA
jgi:hypothetical protein